MVSTLNPSLYKLRVSQTKCPVSKGQILPLIPEKLKLNQNDSLNNASLDSDFYYVSSVSKQTSHSSREGNTDTYHLALTPVEWEPVEMKWFPKKSEGGVSPHPFDISISSEQLHDNFGILTKATTNKATLGAISEFVGELFKKAGKYTDWLEKYQNTDFDVLFRSVAHKTFEKSARPLTKEDKEDIFQNALIALSSKEVVEKFDDEKGSFINYIWGALHNYLRNEMRVFFNAEKYEKVLNKINLDENITLEEEMDYLNKDGKPTPEDEVIGSELLEDVKEYISAQDHGDTLNEILDLLLQRVPAREIFQIMNISRAYLYRHIDKIVKHMRDYAEDAEDEMLLAAIKKNTGHKKESSLIKAEEENYDIDVVNKIFKTYNELTSGKSDVTAEDNSNKVAERVPVGETIKIQRRPIPNFEDLTKQVVQDPEKSSAQASKDVEAYIQQMIGADELIESDGKLIAINITRRE